MNRKGIFYILSIYFFLVCSPATLGSQDLQEGNIGLTSEPSMPKLDGDRIAKPPLFDPKSRVSPLFSVPQELNDHVNFWLKIYTEVGDHQLIVYDRNHPEVIYEILDLSDQIENSKNRIQFESLKKSVVQKLRLKYDLAFRGLIKKSLSKKTQILSPLETRISAATQQSIHDHNLEYFRTHIRIQSGQRNQIISGMNRARLYMPYMKTILRNEGIPEEVVYITLLESSFNLRAYSKAGAMGVWQIMPRSGREFLYIDPQHKLDERSSPIKSTFAAAKLLQRNLRLVGNWPFAITAYHSGQKRIFALLKKNPEARYRPSLALISCPFSAKKQGFSGTYLGLAGRNYYSEFLALTVALSYPEIFYPEEAHQWDHPEFGAVHIVKLSSIHLPQRIMAEHSIPFVKFQFLNPEIPNLNRPLPRGFSVVVAD